MKTLIIISLILFHSLLCGAETPVSCKKMIDSFFMSIDAGENEKAITDFMKEKLKWGGKDKVIQMVGVLNGFNKELIGAFRGYDIVHQSSIGENYLLIVAMAKFDRQPVFYRFIFYRPVSVFMGDSLNMYTDEDKVIKEWMSGDNEIRKSVTIP